MRMTFWREIIAVSTETLSKTNRNHIHPTATLSIQPQPYPQAPCGGVLYSRAPTMRKTSSRKIIAVPTADLSSANLKPVHPTATVSLQPQPYPQPPCGEVFFSRASTMRMTSWRKSKTVSFPSLPLYCFSTCCRNPSDAPAESRPLLCEKRIKLKPFWQRNLLHSMFCTGNSGEFVQ